MASGRDIVDIEDIEALGHYPENNDNRHMVASSRRHVDGAETPGHRVRRTQSKLGLMFDVTPSQTPRLIRHWRLFCSVRKHFHPVYPSATCAPTCIALVPRLTVPILNPKVAGPDRPI